MKYLFFAIAILFALPGSAQFVDFEKRGEEYHLYVIDDDDTLSLEHALVYDHKMRIYDHVLSEQQYKKLKRQTSFYVIWIEDGELTRGVEAVPFRHSSGMIYDIVRHYPPQRGDFGEWNLEIED